MQPIWRRLFSNQVKVKTAYQSWILAKNEIQLMLNEKPDSHKLSAALNLYALNSAILASRVNNRILAQKAESLRLLSEEFRNFKR